MRAERRLFEEAVGDLLDRAAADGIDAGDREKVDHQRVRGLGFGARHRREHAFVFGTRAGGLHRQHVEIALEAAGAVEILHQAALPRRREVEAFDQRGKQADVAHADLGRGDAELGDRFKPEREHLGIGGGGVGAAEGFHAGLQEFVGAVVALAEHRAQIAEAGRLAGFRRTEVVARHRDGEIGPQAEFLAAPVGGQEHALADVLARQVEERLGRLDQRRQHPPIAGARIRGDKRLRPRIGLDRLGYGRGVVHGTTWLHRDVTWFMRNFR